MGIEGEKRIWSNEVNDHLYELAGLVVEEERIKEGGDEVEGDRILEIDGKKKQLREKLQKLGLSEEDVFYGIDRFSKSLRH